jgi:signal transduction histidine kinase
MFWLRLIYVVVVIALAIFQARNSTAVRRQQNEITQVRGRILKIEAIHRNRRVRSDGNVEDDELAELVKRIERLEQSAGPDPQEQVMP